MNRPSQETWGILPCRGFCGPCPGLNGFASLDLCFLSCKMSQLVLTSTLPSALLCYSRLGKELRFRYVGWGRDFFSHPFPPGFLELPGNNPTVSTIGVAYRLETGRGGRWGVWWQKSNMELPGHGSPLERKDLEAQL